MKRNRKVNSYTNLDFSGKTEVNIGKPNEHIQLEEILPFDKYIKVTEYEKIYKDDFLNIIINGVLWL